MSEHFSPATLINPQLEHFFSGNSFLLVCCDVAATEQLLVFQLSIKERQEPMSRIPFKKHLLILVVCILAICIVVPVATFAKGSSSPGEQKRVQPQGVAAAQGQPTPITADCSSPQSL